MADPKCGVRWTSDPSRNCEAKPFNGEDGPCWAHHPDRANLVNEVVKSGTIELSDSEIDTDCVGLALEVFRIADSNNTCILSAFRRATFTGDARFNGVTFTGDAVFNEASFTGDARFDEVTFAGDAWFDEASFTGEARFDEVTFSGAARFNVATFTGAAVFNYASFAGDAVFGGASFTGQAVFCGASFTGSAGFAGASFAGEVVFEEASFTRSAGFAGASFTGDAGFGRASFRKAWFAEASFIATAWFAGASFTGEARFDEVTFSGAARFDQASFTGAAVFNEASFARDAVFEEASFAGDTRFNEASFAGDAVFGGASFTGNTLFNEASFTGNAVFDHAVGETSVLLHFSNAHFESPIRLVLGAPPIALSHLVLRNPLIVTAADSAQASIADLSNGLFLAPLTIGDGVSLSETRFVGTTGLEQLRFRDDPLWQRWHRRQVLADERFARRHIAELDDAPPLSYRQVEAIYRQLRASLEASKAAPAAADFYYGELEMRRLAAPRASVERWLLLLYKWIGGYGVKAWRPFVTYMTILLVTTFGFRYRTRWWVGADLQTKGADGLMFHRYWDAGAFVARNSISLLQAPAAGLTAGGTFVLVLERFSAVTLLALGVLAVRARVQR